MLRNRTARDDSGSLVIAMTVMFVLALLSIGVVARSMASQTQVRRSQDFNGALAGADAGIADALYQLDQDKTGPFGKPNVSLPGGDTFSYNVTQATVPLTSPALPDPNRYFIHASGTVNGVRHNVMVTARRRQRFDYVMFARDRLDLNGNCSPSFGPVGSSGVVKTSTNCTPRTDCFLRDNGIPAQKSNGCGDSGTGTYGATNNPNPNGRKINETNRKPSVDETLAALPPTMSSMGCPWQSSGVISGTITGSTNQYYLCNRSGGFTLSGTVEVTSPPALIFIMTGKLTLADGVQVNSSSTSNPASNFQIYVKDRNANMELKGGASFIGGLYALESDFLFSPSGTNSYKGSLIASGITVNGAPNLGYLDQSLQTITIENWKITEYREVPSSCPLTSTSC